MRSRPSILLLFGVAGIAGCGEADAVLTADGRTNEVAGGTRDLRWAASGYLTSGPSMDGLDRAKPSCGATLVAKNVALTAAHCVLDDKTTYAFGSGDAGGGPVVRIVERKLHPAFSADTRANDIAYLILEHDVQFVEPAELPTTQPAPGCTVQAIGYRPVAGAIAVRASTPACVSTAIDRTLLEVHPETGGALCLAEADEGSAVVARDATRTVLVGIYAGGVARGPNGDGCVVNPATSFESTFDYREFLGAGVVHARSLH